MEIPFEYRENTWTPSGRCEDAAFDAARSIGCRDRLAEAKFDDPGGETTLEVGFVAHTLLVFHHARWSHPAGGL